MVLRALRLGNRHDCHHDMAAVRKKPWPLWQDSASNGPMGFFLPLDTPRSQCPPKYQALRIGDAFFVAHPSELLQSLDSICVSDARRENLFVLGYSNGSIGYVPDDYEIERGGYAALQSPKFTGQYPFTPKSGQALVEAMLAALRTIV